MRLVLASVVVAGLVGLGAPAQAQHGRAPEGGDTQPCAASTEFDVVYLGEKRHRITMTVDHRGKVVSKKRIDQVLGGFGESPVGASAPVQVVRYKTCDERPDHPEFLAEFNLKTKRLIAATWNYR